MVHIDYYLATISPFTYLAGPEFEKSSQSTARR